MTVFHVGVDIDNTIIDYNLVFGPVGEEVGLLRPGHGLRSKAEVKASLLATPNGEESWKRLQGQVYGHCISRAVLYPGIADFLRMARNAGARVSLVSHKTRYGHYDLERVDLWRVALVWLEAHGFFAADGFGLRRKDVHFLETREAKIATIGQIGCNLFIDDLPEVLQHEKFPIGVRRIWFGGSGGDADDLIPCRDWMQITSTVAPLLMHHDTHSECSPLPMG